MKRTTELSLSGHRSSSSTDPALTPSIPLNHSLPATSTLPTTATPKLNPSPLSSGESFSPPTTVSVATATNATTATTSATTTPLSTPTSKSHRSVSFSLPPKRPRTERTPQDTAKVVTPTSPVKRSSRHSLLASASDWNSLCLAARVASLDIKRSFDEVESSPGLPLPKIAKITHPNKAKSIMTGDRSTSATSNASVAERFTFDFVEDGPHSNAASGTSRHAGQSGPNTPNTPRTPHTPRTPRTPTRTPTKTPRTPRSPMSTTSGISGMSTLTPSATSLTQSIISQSIAQSLSQSLVAQSVTPSSRSSGKSSPRRSPGHGGSLLSPTRSERLDSRYSSRLPPSYGISGSATTPTNGANGAIGGAATNCNLGSNFNAVAGVTPSPRAKSKCASSLISAANDSACSSHVVSHSRTNSNGVDVSTIDHAGNSTTRKGGKGRSLFSSSAPSPIRTDFDVEDPNDVTATTCAMDDSEDFGEGSMSLDDVSNGCNVKLDIPRTPQRNPQNAQSSQNGREGREKQRGPVTAGRTPSSSPRRMFCLPSPASSVRSGRSVTSHISHVSHGSHASQRSMSVGSLAASSTNSTGNSAVSGTSGTSGTIGVGTVPSVPTFMSSSPRKRGMVTGVTSPMSGNLSNAALGASIVHSMAISPARRSPSHATASGSQFGSQHGSQESVSNDSGVQPAPNAPSTPSGGSSFSGGSVSVVGVQDCTDRFIPSRASSNLNFSLPTGGNARSNGNLIGGNGIGGTSRDGSRSSRSAMSGMAGMTGMSAGSASVSASSPSATGMGTSPTTAPATTTMAAASPIEAAVAAGIDPTDLDLDLVNANSFGATMMGGRGASSTANAGGAVPGGSAGSNLSNGYYGGNGFHGANDGWFNGMGGMGGVGGTMGPDGSMQPPGIGATFSSEDGTSNSDGFPDRHDASNRQPLLYDALLRSELLGENVDPAYSSYSSYSTGAGTAMTGGGSGYHSHSSSSSFPSRGSGFGGAVGHEGPGTPFRERSNNLRFVSPRQLHQNSLTFHNSTDHAYSSSAHGSVVHSFDLRPLHSSQNTHDDPSNSNGRMSLAPFGSYTDKRKRKIAKVPTKVLDAPSLQDDFYLNLVDWSSLNFLAVGLGSCVYLWSASTSRVTQLCDFSSTEDSVTSVAWSEGGRHLAVGTTRGDVQIWDATACKLIRNMEGHSARIGSLSWKGGGSGSGGAGGGLGGTSTSTSSTSPSSSAILASGSRDRLIHIRDPRSDRPYEMRLCAHKQEVCGLKFSHDERSMLASGGNDNKLLVWDIKKHVRPVHTFADHTAAVKAIAFSPHQHGLLASGGGTADRCIRFWNCLTGAGINCIDTGSQVCNLAWSKNVNEIVSTHGYSLNQIVVWKYPTMQKMATLTGHTYRVLYLSVSPDGSTIVTGAGDETLRFWQVFPGPQKENNSSGGLLFPSMPGSVIR